MNPMKQLTSTLRDLADRDRCVFSSSDLLGALPMLSVGVSSPNASAKLAVILSRAVKAGVLERVCRGIYYYPVQGYRQENILFHAAARLRASEFNYLSLETVLSEAGAISQIPMNRITLMSSGRSHVVDCGDFGRIEFVHTEQKAGALTEELVFDSERRLWRGSVKQALRDARVTRRSQDLINSEEAYEFI
jgi:hypothetical protein